MALKINKYEAYSLWRHCSLTDGYTFDCVKKWGSKCPKACPFFNDRGCTLSTSTETWQDVHRIMQAVYPD